MMDMRSGVISGILSKLRLVHDWSTTNNRANSRIVFMMRFTISVCVWESYVLGCLCYAG